MERPTIYPKAVDHLVFSNLWIAAAAWALYLANRVMLDLPVSVSPEGGFIFMASISGYGLLRLIAANSGGTDDQLSMMHSWVRSHSLFVQFLIVACAAGAGVFFWLSPPLSKVLMSISCLLAFFYGIPLFSGKAGREFGQLKTFLVSLVWTLLCAGIPLGQAEGLHWPSAACLLLANFLLVLAYTVPFDLRDLEQDRVKGMQTFPMKFGQEWTLQLSVRLLLLAWGMFGAFLLVLPRLLESPYKYDFPLDMYIFLWISLVVVMLSRRFVSALSGGYSEYSFTFVIDGLLLLMGSGVVVLSIVF